ncbi:hypothetical protein JW933_06890 [candidate division FCPU426 bacterium]|nr:hypothetical protein [candidate division FCPU426 bacterium]
MITMISSYKSLNRMLETYMRRLRLDLHVQFSLRDEQGQSRPLHMNASPGSRETTKDADLRLRGEGAMGGLVLNTILFVKNMEQDTPVEASGILHASDTFQPERLADLAKMLFGQAAANRAEDEKTGLHPPKPNKSK